MEELDPVAILSDNTLHLEISDDEFDLENDLVESTIVAKMIAAELESEPVTVSRKSSRVKTLASGGSPQQSGFL
ncbi:UNVERIFIED_CONTAM: hypothetical protein Sindi_1451600 [Sesamum indicum]